MDIISPPKPFKILTNNKVATTFVKQVLDKVADYITEEAE